MSSEETETWTAAEVARREAMLAETEARIRALGEEEARLNRDIADALAAGTPVDDMRARRQEARSLRDDLQAAANVMRGQVARGRAASLRAEAGARLEALGRAHTALCGRYDRDLSRIAAVAAELGGAVAAAAERFDQLQGAEIEVLALRDRWPDLPAPELRRATRPAAVPGAVAALRSLGDLRLADAPPTPGRLVDVPPRQATALRARIPADGPTRDILDRAGPPPGDPDTRYRRAMADRRDAQDAARAAEIRRVDGWLRERLAGGPVDRDDVMERARRDGIPLTGIGHVRTLMDARAALGVVSVHPLRTVPTTIPGRPTARETDTGTTLWALPGAWDDTDYREAPTTGSRTPAAAVRW